MAAATAYKAPGRLSDPEMAVKDDPRADPRLVQMLAMMGMDRPQPPSGLDSSTPMEQITAVMKASEEGFSAAYGIPNELPGDNDEPEVKMETQTIKGVDGNDINLYIWRPTHVSGPLPCVIYTHGGGMTIISTRNKVHDRWCKSMAVKGAIAVQVDFRNAYTAEKHNPFPAGLNDCAAAAKWVVEHKKDLGISKLIIQGESGGGNLAIATTLKAKQDGWGNGIDGVYACVPYISGGYGWSQERQLKEIPSVVECGGYLLDIPMYVYSRVEPCLHIPLFNSHIGAAALTARVLIKQGEIEKQSYLLADARKFKASLFGARTRSRRY